MRRIAVLLCALFVVTGPLFANVASATTVVLPTVAGGFGTSPSISFPAGSAPSGLQVKVLSTGHGQTVAKGELLVANYIGQIWNGKVFDSSFSRHETAAFPIGIGAVVKGWDEGLVGKKVGSRVLLVVPPSLGYGSSGNSQAGITGTDTLVFVVDIVGAYAKTVGNHESATVLKTTAGGVSIAKLLTTAPTVKVAKGTKKPAAANSVVLARGSGAKTTTGMVILQFVAADWTSKLVTSTWSTGTPDGEYVGSKSTPSVFDSLVGDRVGSRVLLELPANSGGGPYALAVEIAAEVPASASA